MSSLNVRFAQKTRGKTDFLNCTNLPGNDGLAIIIKLERAPHRECNSKS